MAKPGQIMECGCGTHIKVPKNGRIAWHKKPDGRGNCQRSGLDATSSDSVALVGNVVARCPACGEGGGLQNSKGAYPVVCKDCGFAGTERDLVLAPAVIPQAPELDNYLKGRYAAR